MKVIVATLLLLENISMSDKRKLCAVSRKNQQLLRATFAIFRAWPPGFASAFT